MLALRRLPRYAPRLVPVRTNATLEAAAVSSAAAAPPPPPAPMTAQSSSASSAVLETAENPSEGASEATNTPRKGPTRRPHITLENPREWCRPLAKGVEPAYDHALQYILADAAALREELKALRHTLAAELGKPEGERDEGAVAEMRKKVEVLEIQSEANLPDVRWKARNGMGEFWGVCDEVIGGSDGCGQRT